MSRAGAYIQSASGGIVAYTIYDGGCDTLAPCLTADPGTAWDIDNGTAQRPDGRTAWDAVQACTHTLEDGYAYANYGSGFYWPVQYCMRCMVVHGPLGPWWVLDTFDGPSAWDHAWPRDGTPPIDVGASGQRALPPPK